MRFTRKVPSQSNGNLVQRVHMFVYGTALLLLLILIHWQNDDDYFILHSSININSTNSVDVSRNNNEEEVVHPISIMGGGEHGQFHDLIANVTSTNSQSLLNSPNAIKNIPPCKATLHPLNSAINIFNSSQMALFSGWDAQAISKWGDRSRFQDDFGNYMQYIKGRDVQPLKDKRGIQCKASTRSLVKAMGRLGRKREDVDLLFFTNDRENPVFMDGISKYYSIPAPLGKLDTFEKGFSVFSAMEQGSSHPFHYHDAAWLGQVSGSRLWFLLPPDTPRRVVGKKVNGCDYLLGRSPLPKGVSACVQGLASVMYLPPRWLHATCALEPWSVGIGGQGGDPSMYHQKFDQLESKLNIAAKEDEDDKKFMECGVFTEDVTIDEEY